MEPLKYVTEMPLFLSPANPVIWRTPQSPRLSAGIEESPKMVETDFLDDLNLYVFACGMIRKQRGHTSHPAVQVFRSGK